MDEVGHDLGAVGIDVVAADGAEDVGGGDGDGLIVVEGGDVEGLPDGGVEVVEGAIVGLGALGVREVLDLAGLDEVALALALAVVVDAAGFVVLAGRFTEASGGHDVLAGGVDEFFGSGFSHGSAFLSL